MVLHSVTEASSKQEGAKVSTSSDAAHRQKGVYAFIYTMESCMNSMSDANKGSAAELNAQSQEAEEIAQEYKNIPNLSKVSLHDLQNEAGLESQIISQEMLQNQGNNTQQEMGIYGTNIANTEQGVLTAALNGKAMVNSFGKMVRG